MSDLLEFLRARLDEDERVARASAAANPGSVATHWSAEQVDYLSSTGLRGKAWAVVPERVEGATIAISPTEIRPLVVTHIARHDPARVLRDVEAKRKMIEQHVGYFGSGDDEFWPVQTLRLLVLPYADHPDYREAWRP